MSNALYASVESGKPSAINHGLIAPKDSIGTRTSISAANWLRSSPAQAFCEYPYRVHSAPISANIGFTLDAPPDQRVEGTAAAVAVGIVRGADIVRVHDVPQIARVAKMTDALVRAPA